MKTIPFSILPPGLLRGASGIFCNVSSKIYKKMPHLKSDLKAAEIDINPTDYISMSIMSSVLFLVFGTLLALFLISGPLGGVNLDQSPTGAFSIAIPEIPSSTIFAVIAGIIIIAVFIFIRRMSYPKLKSLARVKEIDRNLLPALQHLLVQLNAGTPIFDAIVSVSGAGYGELSKQFKMAVRNIHAGKNQIQALEQVADENPSPYFRRALWQITTGMKIGSDVTKVIENTIENLSEEQVIQIQKYGGQLNPLAMFYMLLAVILPSLSLTFITVLAAFTNMSSSLTQIVFWGLFAGVFFFQILFLGIIRSRRPNLLE